MIDSIVDTFSSVPGPGRSVDIPTSRTFLATHALYTSCNSECYCTYIAAIPTLLESEELRDWRTEKWNCRWKESERDRERRMKEDDVKVDVGGG